jgi:hypothetical protein
MRQASSFLSVQSASRPETHGLRLEDQQHSRTLVVNEQLSQVVNLRMGSKRSILLLSLQSLLHGRQLWQCFSSDRGMRRKKLQRRTAFMTTSRSNKCQSTTILPPASLETRTPSRKSSASDPQLKTRQRTTKAQWMSEVLAAPTGSCFALAYWFQTTRTLTRCSRAGPREVHLVRKPTASTR